MSKLSDYQIVRALGHGAFGTTFLVSEIGTGKQCAWKRITIANSQDRRMVLSEVEMLSRVRGEFLVSFVGSFEDNQDFYILMEYCDKGDLRKYLNDIIENNQIISEDA
ncbi:MAG: hypothetical protein EZS28_022169 [Streblomastix strix]|uniref:non-specific serine/threonine protein kinase n=1 Tax=Streblomastix strix TaxID=222440 RepID=A0A5J4VIL4_9EUKA|nr:MAG: hypothetical protein EZS28_022169 [Streblomastix strix]